AEHRQHPGAEGALLRPAERIFPAAEDRRRKIEAEPEIALELVAELLLELAVCEEARDLVLVLVGEQFSVVDRNRARQRLAVAALDRGVAHLVDQGALALR